MGRTIKASSLVGHCGSDASRVFDASCDHAYAHVGQRMMPTHRLRLIWGSLTIASLVSFVASLAATGLFENIRISSDGLLFWAAIFYALLAVMVGVFSREISEIARFLLGKKNVVLIEGQLDHGTAKRLAELLRGRGIYVWNDVHDLLPGDDIFDEVENKILESDAVIFVTDPEGKLYQQRVAEFCVNNGVKTIPIAANDGELPEVLSRSWILRTSASPETMAEQIVKSLEKTPRRQRRPGVLSEDVERPRD